MGALMLVMGAVIGLSKLNHSDESKRTELQLKVGAKETLKVEDLKAGMYEYNDVWRISSSGDGAYCFITVVRPVTIKSKDPIVREMVTTVRGDWKPLMITALGTEEASQIPAGMDAKTGIYTGYFEVKKVEGVNHLSQYIAFPEKK